jgi:hypothetical protein
VRGPCRVGMQWGVRGLFGEGGRVGGGGGSPAIEHSEVCTLCYFGHLK